MNIAPRIDVGSAVESVEIRVRGRVQGVGFRPFVWRTAREIGLSGYVRNDAEGVLIRVRGEHPAIEALLRQIRMGAPSLASIQSVEHQRFLGELPATFEIAESTLGRSNTEIAPDAALCADCEREIFDPFSRRYRYPFTTCTNCGPRLSIVRSVPYDRLTTSMAAFDLCSDCAAEYGDPRDRRFHAEATACHVCGPKARLFRFDGKPFNFDQASMLDEVDAALGLIQKGEIVAIKGLGGYQLACDATRVDAVESLRERKHRDRKPFALMARDLEVIRRYVTVTAEDEAVLKSACAPIVLLDASGSAPLPEVIAPGLRTLGFMLPNTPLHALLLRRMSRPVVMTSGNCSDAPQVIDDVAAQEELSGIATYVLAHDRDILNRVDDSVVQNSAGKTRVLRRSRGYAPAAIGLPRGFEQAPELFAAGGDLKNTFCIVKSGSAVLSQHIGDLVDARTFDDYTRSINLYRDMTDVAPTAIVCDRHPGYSSKSHAESMCRSLGVPLIEVQHHHAHVASCLVENGWPLDGGRVLGISLDGLGYGADGGIWGGEFLLADYRHFERLGTFKPVAMIGGDAASREPWRNLYAHLTAEMGWSFLAMNFADLEIFHLLESKPREIIESMLQAGVNSPKASSCGRLFDAAAAAMGLCFERQGYEGEAAAMLEAAVDREALWNEDEALAYPFTIPNLKGSRLPYVEPLAAWNAILGDLILKTPVGIMAARFHRGLARVISAMCEKLVARDSEAGPRFDTVALSGGCFHNRVLLEQVTARLESMDFKVLTQANVPSGDGGLSLGQAAIAAAQLIECKNKKAGGSTPCVSAFQDAS
ncbi:carbamoyltransferase HypF [Hyphomicrobium sp.]|uniref:carbamoyltransferase HypF n=1 Tax=Hyphomicrobium sp. TaxID=82 RepID=UPI000FB42672|nr:carbamoyltransferase HypF [Hyphomicrobium sp.]RUO97373.1 MAG: carbamoyltransferase HypF [Hyphomicrobium sp.]